MPDAMSNDTIAELRRLAAAATAGPWTPTGESLTGRYYKVRGTQLGLKWAIANCPFTVACDGQRYDDAEAKANATFIAVARNALPALLDALDAATQRAEAAEAQLQVVHMNPAQQVIAAVPQRSFTMEPTVNTFVLDVILKRSEEPGDCIVLHPVSFEGTNEQAAQVWSALMAGGFGAAWIQTSEDWTGYASWIQTSEGGAAYAQRMRA